jgi:hypothetical protein
VVLAIDSLGFGHANFFGVPHLGCALVLDNAGSRVDWHSIHMPKVWQARARVQIEVFEFWGLELDPEAQNLSNAGLSFEMGGGKGGNF